MLLHKITVGLFISTAARFSSHMSHMYMKSLNMITRTLLGLLVKVTVASTTCLET